MSRLVVVPQKEGGHDEARRLLERDAPIEREATQLDRHDVYAGGDG
jgi:hypothetical protein